jgi:tetratricopeptide (TPR) repeat protein
MNWREYEGHIRESYQAQYPGAAIKSNVKIIGRYSKVERQVDILIEDYVAGSLIRIVIDGKLFSRKINVKDVETFISFIEDLEADQGIIITEKGYSAAALNRAYYGPVRVELDILNCVELKFLQGCLAVPYSGNDCVILKAPLGWVIDAKRTNKWLAATYRRGFDIKQAMKNHEFIYINYWKRRGEPNDLDGLLKYQEASIREVDRDARIDYPRTIQRKDARTALREAIVKNYPALEITGFVEFEDFIFFAVMFTKPELRSVNLKKLEYVLGTIQPAKINFDNTLVITQAQERLKNSQDGLEKASLARQIGRWYHEMGKRSDALQYYEVALGYSPKNHQLLKEIIGFELMYAESHSAFRHASELFDIDPKNPTLPQDIIEIFERSGHLDEVAQFFEMKRRDYQGRQEELGNLYYHEGLVCVTLGQKKRAKECLGVARSNFRIIFPPEHYIFRNLDKLVRQCK